MKQFICDSCECAKKHGPCILTVPSTDDDCPVNCPYLCQSSKPNWRDYNPQPSGAEPDNTLTLHYEFKPCPCCGGKPTFYIDDNCIESASGIIQCTKCLLTLDAKRLSDLAERWNKRVTLD